MSIIVMLPEVMLDKACSIAGWEPSDPVYDCDPSVLDALASEMMRKVNLIDDYHYDVVSYGDHTAVLYWENGHREIVGYSEGPDRTANTIAAIVEFSEGEHGVKLKRRNGS